MLYHIGIDHVHVFGWSPSKDIVIYGNEDVSGDAGRHNGLTQAWLGSSLTISPLEQLAFSGERRSTAIARRAHAYEMTDHVTVLTQPLERWVLHGKTGSGIPKRADGSNDEAHALGWFVGWAERNGRSVVFARLIQDERQEAVSAGYRARDTLLHDLPPILDRP